jgi:UDP-4-amino-4-deoxy-L-arabinose-oxoglutarate aminotransferase
MRVEFYKHNIGQEEIDEVCDTLKSTFLTTGPKTRRFEEAFSKYLSVKHSIGVSNWTNGAFVLLKAWGIGPGDEVIVPPLTFISTANIVLHCGAKPVFADVEPETGNLSLKEVEKKITSKTKAIIPVHLYGQMVDMKGFRALAAKYSLKILEDAAHCIEGTRDGIRPGQLGDAACFSFYATKNITCGEGGAVATNDSSFIDTFGLLKLHGMNKSAADRYTGTFKHWDMECLGYKANLSDIQSALLLGQLKNIENLWEQKEAISQTYEKTFKTAGVSFPKVLPNSKSARHLFTVWAPPGKRDELVAYLQKKEIGVAVNFRAIHLLKYYRETFGYKKGNFPVAESIGDRTISIPLYPKLTPQEVEYVSESVVKGFKELS